MPSSHRVLVAGVGNVFLGDDGFGVAVVRELAGTPLPEGVELFDVGTRALHLAYELVSGCGLLILVDASARGQPPGTVSLLRIEEAPTGAAPALADAHGLTADSVLALARRLGGDPPHTLLVACEPDDLAPGMALSAPVRAAVPEAVRLIRTVLAGGGPMW